MITMATGPADQHSDFDSALSAGLGVTSRLWYRTLAGNLRTRLASGERVADVALTGEHASLGDAYRANTAAWPGAPAGTILLVYAAGGFVLGAVFDVAWPVLIAVLIGALALEATWRGRRRAHRGGERSRPLRSLVMVTDRRLIEGIHPDRFRELPLERVQDVQVCSGNRGVATVRVTAEEGDSDIHVISDWPKRRALPAAEAIADAIRRGASSHR
jgi:hypothetical protein